MTDAQHRIAVRPKRADGQRNYDAVLTAARKAFAAEGAGASLEEIAGQAGVAIGTLYRHFPSRASLVEAATREGLGDLVARARRNAASSASPLTVLVEWMRAAVEHFSTFRGLVGILAASMYDEGTPSYAACREMHDCGAELLLAAQRAGQVRPDLTADELFDLLTSAAWIRETSPAGTDHSIRVLEVLVDGMAAHTR